MPMRTVRAAIIAGALVLQPAITLAQAWVPAARQVSVNVTYEYLDLGDHLMSDDVPPELGGDGTRRWDLGTVTAQSAYLYVDAGITDRIAASAAIAYVASKYEGTDPESEVDDGTWNRGFQDFVLGLRYMLLRTPIVVTPSIEGGIPSHSYETVGHAALGRDVKELRLGLNLGWTSRDWLPGFYVQGAYIYPIAEEIEGIRPNRSDTSIEAGYFVTENMVLWGTGAYTHVHEGLDWLTDYDDHYHDHDRLAKQVATTAGGGVSYSFGPSNVGVSVITTLSGENAHDGTVLAVSVGRTFSLPR